MRRIPRPAARFLRASSRFRMSPLFCLSPIAAAVLTVAGSPALALAAADSPLHAVKWISYEPGMGAPVGYTNPVSALGEPTRFTGVGVFPSVVSPFSSPFLGSEIVAIGVGGHLTLQLGTPAINRPENPYGVDLIVFSNAFFIDLDYPMGIAGGLFGAGEGIVEVSDDGQTWHVVPDVAARGAFPTLGYLDSGPFDQTPGRVPSDFHLPVDPAIDPDDLFGLDYEALLAVYAGSGGGTGIDLSTVGLESATHVRISVSANAPNAVPIDAITVVPARSRRVFADLNGDGIVDGADLGLLLSAWGESGFADLNGDGVVDGADLGLLLAAWSDGA